MSTYKFQLEGTSAAYSGQIPERAWAVVSRHTTLAAANRALDAGLAEMHRACGDYAWNGHYRVTPLRNVRMTTTFHCNGRTGGEEEAVDMFGCIPCPDAAEADVPWIWPADTDVGDYEPQSAPGWVSPECCERCYPYPSLRASDVHHARY